MARRTHRLMGAVLGDSVGDMEDSVRKEFRLNNMERNEMLEQLRNLRCCGNCTFCYSALTCAKTLDPTFADVYCDLWCYDGQTTEDRRIT